MACVVNGNIGLSWVKLGKIGSFNTTGNALLATAGYGLGLGFGFGLGYVIVTIRVVYCHDTSCLLDSSPHFAVRRALQRELCCEEGTLL